MSVIRRHLTYANVMSTIAVFAALGAGAAFALPGKNSVDSGDIINGQVRSKDVRDLTLTGVDIEDDSVTGNDIKNGFLTGLDVEDDALEGADIDESSLGPVPSLADDGITASNLGAITRRSGNVSVPGGTGENGSYFTEEQTVSCMAGEIALSGEAYWAGEDDEELFISEMIYSQGGQGPNGLSVTGGNDSGTDRQLNIAVYCLAP